MTLPIQRAEANADALRAAEPDVPEALSDRAADAWEPLLAIADLAGGDWPRCARNAAVILSGGEDADETSRGIQLLAAIRDAMSGLQVISTEELQDGGNADEELPFGGWNEGKGLAPRELARLLKSYGIRPRTIRVGERTARRCSLASTAAGSPIRSDATRAAARSGDVAMKRRLSGEAIEPFRERKAKDAARPNPSRSTTSALAVP